VEHSLSGNQLLAALHPADVALLGEHLFTRMLLQGSVLQKENAPIEQVLFPHNGVISLMVRMSDGDSIETVTVGREGVINALAELNAPSAFTAIVQLPGRAFGISVAQFQTAMRQSEGLREVIRRYEASLLAQVQRTAACNALHPIVARFARWLLQVHDRSNGRSLQLSQDTLAQILGVRRTTITKAMSELQARGFIRYGRNRITVVDKQLLEQSACECYQAMQRPLGDDGIA